MQLLASSPHENEEAPRVKNRSPLSRLLSVTATLAVAVGLSLTGVSAAHADGGFSVSGVVHGPGPVVLEDVEVTLEIPDPGYSSTVLTRYTDATGVFDFSDVPVGGPYTVRFWLDGYGPGSTAVTIVDADITVPSTVLLPYTDTTTATATISGTGELGTDLTVATSGWPADTVFTYQWYAPEENSSGDIAGAESATYTVTADVIGREVRVLVFGSVPDVSASNGIASTNGVTAFDPERPTAAPPADLDAYLADHGSTPQAQTTAGLPAGPLNPGTTHTADLTWPAADSFVDVYIYSTPVKVGTFPVTNGVARITLSPSVLGQLATGNHTLVATGQTSGSVQSLRLAIGLAATGSELPVLPLSIAAFALLAGTGLLVARRRRALVG